MNLQSRMLGFRAGLLGSHRCHGVGRRCLAAADRSGEQHRLARRVGAAPGIIIVAVAVSCVRLPVAVAEQRLAAAAAAPVET